MNNIERNKEKRQPGTLYKRMAHQCLMTWYSDMPIKEQRDILSFGDFERIEELIGSKDSVIAGLQILERFIKYRILDTETPDLAEVFFWSETPNADLEKLELAIRQSRLQTEDKTKVALDMIDFIHQQWMIDNVAKFFQESRIGKQYMFLPIELIGKDDAMKDYIFIDDILTVLGLKAERYCVEEAYRSRRRQFAKYYDISNIDRIAWYIRDLDDSGKMPSGLSVITKEMHKDTVSYRIANQVIQHSGDPETW